MTNTTKLAIREWNEADRPREKMAAHGAGKLSEAELLAILVGSGSRDESAVDLMRRIMNDCHNKLNELGRKTIDELCQYKGMGPAKAVTILAACELGKRRTFEPKEERPQMDKAEKIFEYFAPKMQDLSSEESWVMLLNQQLRLIRAVLIGKGGLTDAPVDIRLILKEAILSGATGIILCHNHPSGTRRPSSTDDALTERLKKAADLMNIHLYDHVIIAGSDSFYSYAEEGRI